MSLARFSGVIIFVLLLTAAAGICYGQSDLPDATSRTPGRPRNDDGVANLREMLARQKTERDKRDYEEMLKRGEEALRLAKQLETSFEQNKGFSSDDRTRLEALEKVVVKIRKELGADEDSETESSAFAQGEDEPKPSNLQEGFKYLQSTTTKLVDELKKTTRFSISVVAIQTSNNVLKLVRFLRLKK
jgi:hypothetical protein